MTIQKQEEIPAIVEYIKSAKLKGSVEIGENYFWWNLENIELYFGFDIAETKVEYYQRKSKLIYLGHTHCDNSDVLKPIQDINGDNKKVAITVTPIFSTFSVVDRINKQKKSRFFVRRYYSIL